MKWEMKMEEVEAVLERIWDLHDRISDAIHAISRAHFVKSIKETLSEPSRGGAKGEDDDGAGGRRGFVFVKGLRPEDDAALKEARSLDAIRTALENLEDQLEFFHTVQLQQRAERDTAIARLEQSRIVLAMRLAEHQGKKYKVIEEARTFVGDAHDATNRFISPEIIFEVPRSTSSGGRGPGFFFEMMISSFQAVQRSLRLDNLGFVVGNAALFAVSMLAFLQLHQLAFKSHSGPTNSWVSGGITTTGQISFQDDASLQNGRMKQLDVMAARG